MGGSRIYTGVIEGVKDDGNGHYRIDYERQGKGLFGSLDRDCFSTGVRSDRPLHVGDKVEFEIGENGQTKSFKVTKPAKMKM